jgi:magnesium transporter
MAKVDKAEIEERILHTLESEHPDPGALVSALHPADIGNLLESIPPELRPNLWQAVAVKDRGEVLAELPEGVRRDLVRDMDPETLVQAVRELDVDDLADLLPELPDEVTARLLYAVDTETRRELDSLLSFPEDTAGGLMNTDTVITRDDVTLAVVLRYLRLRGGLPDYTDKLFVVDRNVRLTGILFLASLLTTDSQAKVGDVMDDEPITFSAGDRDTDVAAAFERYNLISAPVVDDQRRLLGRITIDDVVDVIREQADHTMMARAGLDEEEDIFAPVAESTRKRAIWLGVNLLTALVASWVIGLFERSIEQMVALAVLMPIVASMGGNAGTQTLTMVVRGLGTGTIGLHNVARVLRKEALVGAMNGIIWSVVVAVVATLWFKDPNLGLVVAVAMIVNLLAAALSGVILPVALERMRIDPALASGVALTTVTDVVGFFSILGLATVMLL